MRIRPATVDDADAVAALRRTVFPYLVMSAAHVRHDLAHRPPTARAAAYVAEVDGEVVGWTAAMLDTWVSEPGAAALDLYVHPGHRRRGTGSALLATAQEHLAAVGARRIRSWATLDAVGYGHANGYTSTRQMRYAGIDLRVLPDLPAAPAGIAVVPMTEVDPRAAYTADAAATLDEPSDAPADPPGYDDWLRETWDSPRVDRACSVAAMDGEVVVAFTAVALDGDRAWTGMTGTLATHRGRGLAKLVKSVALRRAAGRGVTAAYTSNDTENAPMLAVNAWLGYRIVATHTGLVRETGRGVARPRPARPAASM